MNIVENADLFKRLAKLECDISFLLASSNIKRKDRLNIKSTYSKLMKERNIPEYNGHNGLADKIKHQELYLEVLNNYVNSRNSGLNYQI